ncbi:hypothetical protein C2857_006185 [Epichloe festucae Fl1]|uniref:Uncharacterized protein n=1 Tax=Epichloe festucae (strain Fl1) TaxID=877507 RepID=A0A7S9PSL8_EPIFF|nr:hypothetical protein C2857_006185 [Epichloe festucae Fl1]
MRRFCGTWGRENAGTGTCIPEDTRRSIAPYILGHHLARKLGLTTGHSDTSYDPVTLRCACMCGILPGACLES